MIMNFYLQVATVILCLAIVSACTPTRMLENNGASQSPPSSVDEALSIKDLVVSMSPYSYHECSTQEASEWLKNVEIERIAFRGSVCDSIVYGGDGCAGKTRFYLSRAAGKFWEQYYAWEPGSSDRLAEYNVVGSGLSFVSSTTTSPPIPDK